MDQHLHDHIMTSPFGTPADNAERIKELESELNRTKSDLDFFKKRFDERANVKASQGFHDFLDYINRNLLHEDLTISLAEEDDEGVTLFIEDAVLDRSGGGDQPILTVKEQEYYVTGTFTVEWNARVRATSEDAASELIYDLMPSDFDRISVSVYDDAVIEFEVQDYISDHDISDVEPA
ncbi:MAG: hypothetical protein ACO395_07030 [Pontimonas sp.]